MTLKKTLITAALALASMASYAAPIINDNVRPVTFGPGTAGETTLQSVLTSNLGVTTADQSTAGQWGSATGVPLTTVPTLRLEQTSGLDNQIFGIWFGTSSDSLLMIDLILGGADADDSGIATVRISDGQLRVGTSFADCDVDIACKTVNDGRINPLSFGFYFKSGFGETAFSLDSLSNYGSNEQTRFLAYTDSLSNWIFGFEDGGDYDYNDMVVKVESIRAVPEPGTLALLGAGLFGLAALRRRKA